MALLTEWMSNMFWSNPLEVYLFALSHGRNRCALTGRISRGVGVNALRFEIVYDVLDQDFNLNMNIQQPINFRIFQKFREDVVALAYPTRTITLADGHRDQKSAPKCTATLSAPLCGASCRTDRQAGGRVIR